MPQNFNNKILEEKLKKDKQNKIVIFLFIIIGLIALLIFLYKAYLKDYLHAYKYQDSIYEEKLIYEDNNEIITPESSNNPVNENRKNETNIVIEKPNKIINQIKKEEQSKVNDINESIKIVDTNREKTAKFNTDVYCQEYLINEECNLDNLVIELLDNYNNFLKQDLIQKNATNFYFKKMNDIEKLKNESLNHYSLMEKEVALKKILEANNKAKKIIKDLDALFVIELKNANKFFTNSNYDEAMKSINIAFKIKPDDKELIYLKKRIEVLPEVSDLKKDLKKVSAEGRFKEEIIILQKILNLDEYYKQYKIRLANLENKVKEEEYASSIVKSYKFLEDRDYKNSNIQAQKALALKPEGIELKELFTKIIELKRELDLSENLKNANYSMKKDDWELALKYFKQALSIDQRSMISQQGIELAEKIISLKIEIGSFLSNSDRLSSSNVKEYALQVLETSYLVSDNSPSLKKQEIELKNIISLYEKPIEVEVISDGETEILVRGVGKVGKVFKKIIILKPGVYKFEAKRKGYKTKLMRVEIVIGQNIKSIEIICDESI